MNDKETKIKQKQILFKYSNIEHIINLAQDFNM